MVLQLTRSLSRDSPLCTTADLCPRISPATTTAITPEPWKPRNAISSAGR